MNRFMMSCVTTSVSSVPLESSTTTNCHVSDSNANSTGGGGVGGGSTPSSVLNKQRLQDLVHEVDPNVHPDEDVEELLLQLAEDFIADVVETSCKFSKHRKSNTLEVKDVQLSLEKNWNMWVPGFGGEELRPYKKSTTTDSHKQRLALLRKQPKK